MVLRLIVLSVLRDYLSQGMIVSLVVQMEQSQNPTIMEVRSVHHATNHAYFALEQLITVRVVNRVQISTIITVFRIAQRRQ